MANNIAVVEKKPSKKYITLLCIASLISNISQLPIFIGDPIIKSIVFPFWFIIFASAILDNLVVITKEVLLPIVMIFWFSVSILVSELVFHGSYLSSSMVYPLSISMFMFFIGYFVAPRISERDMRYVILFFIITAGITSISIYNQAFASADYALDSQTYAYTSKNSISQIVLTSIVFIALLYTPKKHIYLLFKWGFILVWTAFLLMLQSRATIVGIPLIIAVILTVSKITRQSKVILLICTVVFLAALFINQNVYELVVNNIMFSGRNIDDLDSVSSGRAEHLQIFASMFPNSPWFGVGDYWVESFALGALLQYGIIGAIPLFTIVLYPLFWSIRNLAKDNPLNIAFICITAMYLLNGLFEELAPLGPGVKCYIMWLLFGLLVRWRSSEIYTRT